MTDENTPLVNVEMHIHDAWRDLDTVADMFNEANDVSCVCFDKSETETLLDRAVEIEERARDLVLALNEQLRRIRTKEDLE